MPARRPRSALAVGLLPLRRLVGPPVVERVPVPPWVDPHAYASFLRRLGPPGVRVMLAEDGCAAEVTAPGREGCWVA